MRVIAFVCLAAALLAACGVNGQSNAHVFDASEVPYGLTDTAPPTTGAATAQAAPFMTTTTTASITYDLYFIRGNSLVAVTRGVTAAPSPADLVSALVSGPTNVEVTGGHRTALAGLEITAQPRDSSSVTVDLGRTFNDIPRSDRIFALGQLTLTLTARPGVSLVQYTISDSSIEVPKANGVVTKEPVSRSDYISLLQPPTTSSTSTIGSSAATSR